MARYVKILIDKGVNQWGHNGNLSVAEVRVFSSGVNVALNKPSTGTSSDTPYTTAYNITDGNVTSDFSSAWCTHETSGISPMGSQFAVIDLQEDYNIDSIDVITLNSRGYGFITDYRVDISIDGVLYWNVIKATNKQLTTNPRIDNYTGINNGCYSLYKTGNTAYGVNNGVFEQLSSNWSSLTSEEQKSLFELTNYKNANINDLLNLNNFTVLKYQDSNTQATCTINAVPKDQLILPKGLINIESFEGIDTVSLVSSNTTNSSIKLLVTNDLTNYQTYDFVNGTWQSIDQTNLPEVLAKGINVSDIQNIARTSWDIIANNKSGIGFAYYLKMENTADNCEVDKISLTVDMKGAWEKSTHGGEYKYGYVTNKVLKISLLANGDYKINYSEGAKNP